METVSQQASRVQFSLRITPIAQLLFLGLAVRLLLATLPGFDIDINAFRAWSALLADRGPWNFYDGDFFVDYAPGYLYVLYLFSGLDTIFDFSDGRFEYLLKMPAIAADLGSAYLLYRLLVGQKPSVRLGAAALYLIHPAILFIGPVWGQVDSILAFFLLLTLYYLVKGKLAPASLAYVAGFLVKPQAIAAFPILAFWALRNHKPRDIVQAAAAAFVGGIVLVLPFFPNNPFELVNEILDSTDVYQSKSFWAYNFWGLFDTIDNGVFAMFGTDDATFWGATYQVWGIALFMIALAGIIYIFRESKSPGEMALGIALSTLAFYLFLTRMHERYLFPFFLPALLACASLHSRPLWIGFIGLSVINFLNLYHVYTYYQYVFNHPGVQPDALMLMLQDRVFIFALLATLAFPLMLIAGYLITRRDEKGAST